MIEDDLFVVAAGVASEDVGHAGPDSEGANGPRLERCPRPICVVSTESGAAIRVVEKDQAVVGSDNLRVARGCTANTRRFEIPAALQRANRAGCAVHEE